MRSADDRVDDIRPEIRLEDAGMRRMMSAAIAAALVAFGAVVAAPAQTFPNRPITLVVPFPPGGSTGIVARVLADKMSETLGQSVVIDNRPGAGGLTGARSVVKSPPDGYTLLATSTGTTAIGPSLFPNAGFDPRKDFAPVGRIGTGFNALALHPSVPARTVPELIAYAKQNPGKITFGSAGGGTLSHLSAELFAGMAGIKLTHIPYRGNAPAFTDLLGGHILMQFVPIVQAHTNIASGQVRALGVTGAQRSNLLPDLPTIAEAGVPGYEATQQYGLVAPAGTPRPIIEQLNRALRTALASDEVRKRLAADGAEPVPSTPEEHAVLNEQEHAKWSRLVNEIGLKLE
jgi:tripartite-type tricarboxylate transporter receptor subunit TctC